ncbi:NAD(P)/FAD-dependent oxidoreductase [Gynuella sp.]|uniref:NAD(P)/FAD-dependent oxidoreductase n=1 Tax=Gynuella sp. TaxID=2969146 RepID=UPI003D1471B9
MKYDVAVLGAGMVGVCVAIHLLQQGRSVLLMDRNDAGEETSYGNAGLLQQEAVRPYEFPHEPSVLLPAAFNLRLDVRYHLTALPKLIQPLWSYFRHCSPRRYESIAQEYGHIINMTLACHQELISAAGAEQLIRKVGWISLYRTAKGRHKGLRTLDAYTRQGVNFKVLNGDELAEIEPAIKGHHAGGVHWQDPWIAGHPGQLVKAYTNLFKQLGGVFVQGDAGSLKRSHQQSWQLRDHQDTLLEVDEIVIALGPWSAEITARFGYRPPMFFKRGYHMHYQYPAGQPRLTRAVQDSEKGYMMTPMDAGLRICTGAELGLRDTPSTPVQIDRAEAIARKLIPLGERLDAEPWRGARPCIPDMKPIIGPLPGAPGLWCAFGHGHQGFTMGPATGKLLAAMMTGQTTDIDMSGFRAERFKKP